MPGRADPEFTDDSLWFTQTDADKASAVAMNLATSADTDNMGRRARATYNASLLDGVGLSGFGAWGYGKGSQPSWGSFCGGGTGRAEGCPLVWNYAAAGLDTAQAEIVGQDEPAPFIEVTDGDYDDHRQSVWSGRLLKGIYSQDQGMYHDVWDLARAAWKLAAGCTGTTAIKAKPHPGESKMVFELHDTLDMFIDFFECTYSMPMTYGESTWFDPLRLLACFDDRAIKQKIWDSREPLPKEFGGDAENAPKNMVRLVETWRLQMNKGEPGKYLQSVKQGALGPLYDYAHSSPPFAFLHARRSLCGFYGLPLMERGMRIVERINQILAGLDKSEVLTPKNMLIYDIEASPPGLLQNMRSIMLAGYSSKTNPNAKAPQYITPTVYDQTVVSLLEMHIRAFHETLGINSNQMGATKPQGVVAAVAIRAVADLFTQLFAVLSRDYIKCVTTQLGTLALRSLSDMKKEGKSFKVSWKGDKFMRTVSTDMIDITEKQFTCSVMPVGGSRGSPADRMQLADEMLARKEISEAGYQRILETGDVPAETRSSQRQTSMIAKAIDQWMNDDVEEIQDVSPLPWMNLPEAIIQVLDGYMEALMLDDFPVDRELYFRRYIVICDQMLQKQAAAKAQLSGVAKNFNGPAPAPVDGSGAPGAPPVAA